jgi:hypothetical protein
MDDSSQIGPTDSEKTFAALDRHLAAIQRIPEHERERQREDDKRARFSKLIRNAQCELAGASWPVKGPGALRELFTSGACAAFAHAFHKTRGGQVRRCNSPAHFWVKAHGSYWDVTGRYETELELLQASFEGIQSQQLQISDSASTALEARVPETVLSVAGWDELCGIAEHLLASLEPR